MPNDDSTYDDDRESTSYLWHNYRRLLTPLESVTDKSLIAELKDQQDNKLPIFIQSTGRIL
jgi:hypothetical protein